MSGKNLRNFLATGWSWISHWSGVASHQARGIAQPRILMYHVIGDGETSPAQFEWQLQYLRKHFEPLPLASLLDRIEGGSVSGREVALTFDDGVRNHFTTAWPLLRKHGVPATFFVCPGLIDSEQWLWRTELRLRLEMLDDTARVAVARRAGCRAAEVEPIMEWTKTLLPDALRDFERDVKVLTRHFQPSEAQIAQHTPLTWAQLRALDPGLITIGSHTNTHPILTTLPAEVLEQELGGSRASLERVLRRQVDLFCYPNGVNNADVVAAVRRHYRCALTTRIGLVGTDDDPYLLPRIPAGGSRAAFSRRMHRPTA